LRLLGARHERNTLRLFLLLPGENKRIDLALALLGQEGIESGLCLSGFPLGLFGPVNCRLDPFIGPAGAYSFASLLPFPRPAVITSALPFIFAFAGVAFRVIGAFFAPIARFGFLIASP
jgi:hypothetical protein